MRKLIFTTLAFLSIVFYTNAQALQPFIAFQDDPYNHNMGLTSDGNYYYTVNGGGAGYGKVNKYDLQGEFIEKFDIAIDMRSIEYFNGIFYVSSCDGNIYQIKNLDKGDYSILHENFYTECQTSFAINKIHQSIYIFNEANIIEYGLYSGDIIESFDNIKSGSSMEQYTVACTDHHFYTFDTDRQEIYEYNFDGNLESTYEYSTGSYSFSLSSAGNDIFISIDGDYDIGTWYGYDLTNAVASKNKGNNNGGKSGGTLYPSIDFNDDPYNHNTGITFDGRYYYTSNGGAADYGRINKYDQDGNFLNSYPISIDMRSIEYYDGYFYVSACDGNIYKITDLDDGEYDILYENAYSECQTSFAINPAHGSIYLLNDGDLNEYDLSSGDLLNSFSKIKSGGSMEVYTIACSDNYFYTFDISVRKIYEYDFDGKLNNTYEYSSGDCYFSLSFANDMIFVADDGDYNIGTWYGYKLDGSGGNNKGKGQGNNNNNGRKQGDKNDNDDKGTHKGKH